MDKDFDDSIEVIRNQLTSLYRRIIQSSKQPSDGINEAYEALSVLVEELHQANEQIDLNYEELLQTRQRVEEERARYRELFDLAPDAYLVTDLHGNVLEANRAAAELLNIRQEFLIKKPLTVFVERKYWSKFIIPEGAAQPASEFEIMLQPRHRDPVLAAVKLAIVYNLQRQPAAYRWILRDITEQKRAQYALAASEARFRTIFLGANRGLAMADLKQMIVEANPAFEVMLGTERGGLAGKEASGISADGGGLLSENELSLLISGHEETIHVEKQLRRRNGETFWAHLIASPLHPAKERPKYLLFMIEDVTTAHQATLEFAEMKHRLQNSAEAEQLYIAQEIHNGPLQDLYGAIFKVSGMQNPASPEENQANLKDIHETLENVAGALRNICAELRPPTLEDFGFESAIRNHVEKMQGQYPGLRVNLDLRSVEPALSQSAQLALFRVYQQSILNVIQHAGATQIRVRFYAKNGTVRLSVRDNGKGFSIPSSWLEFVRQGHYGLASIAERVESLGGELAVRSDPEKGTLIEVSLPK